MDLSRIHVDVSRYGQKFSEFCMLELKAVNDIGFLRSITTWKYNKVCLYGKSLKMISPYCDIYKSLDVAPVMSFEGKPVS